MNYGRESDLLSSVDDEETELGGWRGDGGRQRRRSGRRPTAPTLIVFIQRRSPSGVQDGGVLRWSKPGSTQQVSRQAQTLTWNS